MPLRSARPPRAQGDRTRIYAPRVASLLAGGYPRRVKTVSRRSFNSRLFRWHGTSRRPLLIREAADPWQVLVAEVMSQQTGIERVGPPGGGSSIAGRRRPISQRRVPTNCSRRGRGSATTVEPWRYANVRGRSWRPMRSGARDGRRTGCPAWIGPYTARAVAAAAFRFPVAPLDVNVRRVVSRLLGVPSSASGTPGRGGRTGVARSARSLARCRHGSRLGNVYRPRAAVRRVSRRRPLRFARCGRPNRAKSRRSPVRDDLPLAARSSGRSRHRGTRGYLGGSPRTARSTTTPTPSSGRQGPRTRGFLDLQAGQARVRQ